MKAVSTGKTERGSHNKTDSHNADSMRHIYTKKMEKTSNCAMVQSLIA